MKTRYRFIHFKEEGPALKPVVWLCLNNRDGSILGAIEYYRPWKQHVIDFREDCVFNSQCLVDIADFLVQLNDR